MDVTTTIEDCEKENNSISQIVAKSSIDSRTEIAQRYREGGEIVNSNL